MPFGRRGYGPPGGKKASVQVFLHGGALKAAGYFHEGTYGSLKSAGRALGKMSLNTPLHGARGSIQMFRGNKLKQTVKISVSYTHFKLKKAIGRAFTSAFHRASYAKSGGLRVHAGAGAHALRGGGPVRVKAHVSRKGGKMVRVKSFTRKRGR